MIAVNIRNVNLYYALFFTSFIEYFSLDVFSVIKLASKNRASPFTECRLSAGNCYGTVRCSIMVKFV